MRITEPAIAPRSCEAEPSVDGDHLSGHPFRGGIGKIRDPPDRVVWIAASFEVYPTPRNLNGATYTIVWLAFSLDPIDRKHAST